MAEPGKLFVGGLKGQTTEEHLRQYFSKYGELKECVIIFDKETTKSRCFGFINFVEPSAAERVLEDQEHEKHEILERKVDVKIAMPKNRAGQQNNNQGNGNGSNGPIEFHPKKIFVGGLPHNITEEEFTDYFKSFGTVVDHPLIKDKVTGTPRGFGFITFESEESVNNVLRNGCRHLLKGQDVEVKRAEPKQNMPTNVYPNPNDVWYATLANYYWYPYYTVEQPWLCPSYPLPGINQMNGYYLQPGQWVNPSLYKNTYLVGQGNVVMNHPPQVNENALLSQNQDVEYVEVAENGLDVDQDEDGADNDNVKVEVETGLLCQNQNQNQNQNVNSKEEVVENGFLNSEEDAASALVTENENELVNGK